MNSVELKMNHHFQEGMSCVFHVLACKGCILKVSNYRFTCRCYEADFGFFKNTFFNLHNQGSLDVDSKSYCQQNLEPIPTSGTVFVGEADIDFWQSSDDIIEGSFNVGVSAKGCIDILDEVDSLLEEFEPNLMVLSCGLNDLDNGYNSTEVFSLFEDIANKALSASSRVFVFSPALVPQLGNLESDLKLYEDELAKYATSLASEDLAVPKVVYIDVNSAFQSMNPSTLFEARDPNDAPNIYTLSDFSYSLFDSWLSLALEQDTCIIWSNGICEEYLGPAPPTKIPTKSPTSKPTIKHSMNPTRSPYPTSTPSVEPSGLLSENPTSYPTLTPSVSPSVDPTTSPTLTPSLEPTSTPSKHPSITPSAHPSISSRPSVISASPTNTPPTRAPTVEPTKKPIESSGVPTQASSAFAHFTISRMSIFISAFTGLLLILEF